MATSQANEFSSTPQQAGPLTIDEISQLYEKQAAKPRFEGSALGWRIAGYEALLAEGIENPNPALSCEGRQVGPDTKTDLDFEVGYLPGNLKVGPTSGPEKWLCGDRGFSVRYVFNVYGALGNGQIVIERNTRSRRVLEMDIPNDSVSTGDINGTPSIFIHPADDETGLGLGRIVVIQKNTETPFTVLSVMSDDAVPFAELIRIAEGIKG